MGAGGAGAGDPASDLFRLTFTSSFSLPLEQVFVDKIRLCRKDELKSLSVRKYLDAVCVYLWAVTGLVSNVATDMFTSFQSD